MRYNPARLTHAPVSRRRARTGYTLVEIVVAVVVFAVGVIGIQRAAVLALQQARDASTRQRAVALAATHIERHPNGSCSEPGSGATTIRGIRIAWSLGAAVGAHARLLTQAVRYPAGGRFRTDTFQVAVRCR